jgi:hypothetical protein
MSIKNVSSRLRAAAAPIAVAVAAIVATGAAHADAVGQAYLSLTNITFGSSVGTVTVTGGADNGDTLATLAGSGSYSDSANPALFTGFNLQGAVGPNAGSYVPLSAITGSPTGTFSGSSAFINSGDPFTGSAAAYTDDTVSLKPGGNGSAQSNAGLGATFNITVTGGTVLSIGFDATAFLRAFLDPGGIAGSNADASNSWVITLFQGTTKVFQWAPDGLIGTILGGTETADAFAMNDSVQALPFAPEQTSGLESGSFAAHTNTLAAGTYTVNISHKTIADATINVPEPSALSLVGLALVGAGVASRRRRSLVK